MSLARKILEECDCWDGYKRVPGTKPCEPNSCVKETNESNDLKTITQYVKDWFEVDSDNMFKDWDIDGNEAYLFIQKSDFLKTVLAIAEDEELDTSAVRSNLDKIAKALEGLRLKNEIRVKGKDYKFVIQEVSPKTSYYELVADSEEA